MCYHVRETMGRSNDRLLELSLKLEEIALKDDYFVSRRLYSNVDFYSGIIYSALGIPSSTLFGIRSRKRAVVEERSKLENHSRHVTTRELRRHSRPASPLLCLSDAMTEAVDIVKLTTARCIHRTG
jgi:hypothetical protein